MVTEQGRQLKEVARNLGICIDTLRAWLKASGVQMGQANRQNREQQKIWELEAELKLLRKQLGEKDEVIEIQKREIPLHPGAEPSGAFCGSGMPDIGNFTQRIL